MILSKYYENFEPRAHKLRPNGSAAIRREGCMGCGGRRVIMCLKGSVAEHSPSGKKKEREAGIVCYGSSVRGWAAPAGQVNLTAGRLSAERHQTSVTEDAQTSGQRAGASSTSNAWRLPLGIPSPSPPPFLDAAARLEMRPIFPPSPGPSLSCTPQLLLTMAA